MFFKDDFLVNVDDPETRKFSIFTFFKSYKIYVNLYRKYQIETQGLLSRNQYKMRYL